NGQYLPDQTFQLGQRPQSIGVGDFNSDGKLDLVVCGVGVLPGNGDGTFHGPVSYGSGGDAVAIGDFDGRHYNSGQPILDLVTTVANGVNVSLGNDDGTFQNPVFYCLPVPPRVPIDVVTPKPLVADFNGDGNLDIAVSCGSAFVSVLLGNGDGTFRSGYSDVVSDNSNMATADFTGDGRSEIVTNSGQILFARPPDFSLSNASLVE